MDEEAIALMKQHGTYLVPTIYIGEYFNATGSTNPGLHKMLELTRKHQDEFERMVGAAIRAGVKIVVGSDFGGYEAGRNAREFAALVRTGMTAMQAIQAGTRVAAEMLRWEDRIGTLEPGKLADLVAVPGDPLRDISELSRVVFVMLGGKVIKTPEQSRRE